MFKDHMSVIINNNNNNNLKNEVLNLNISANCIPVLWGSISIFVNGKFRFSGWLALLKFLYKEYLRPFALNFKIIQFWGVIGLQGGGGIEEFQCVYRNNVFLPIFCPYIMFYLRANILWWRDTMETDTWQKVCIWQKSVTKLS